MSLPKDFSAIIVLSGDVFKAGFYQAACFPGVVGSSGGSNATISNSAVCLGEIAGNGFVSILNSTIKSAPVGVYRFKSFQGTICFDRTNIMRFNTAATDSGVFDCRFFILGNISFSPSACFVSVWTNSTITRNFNTVTMNGTVPLEKTSLALYNQNNTMVWKGTTDDFGEICFSLSFTDANYTETLRLEAVEGNYCSSANVGFLSDTPVVLGMRYFADLSGDGVVNIVDIAIVARAFGSKTGDQNWNAMADLNKDGVTNILDISAIAKEYGKTV